MPTTPQRQTRQRAAVQDVLADAAEFRTAQQLHELLSARGDRVGLATVYRTLQTLADAGEVDVIRTPDGQSAYRNCVQDPHDHHHHLVCRVCGRAVEVQFGGVEEIIGRLAREHGFTDVQHELELFGLCPDCAARQHA